MTSVLPDRPVQHVEAPQSAFHVIQSLASMPFSSVIRALQGLDDVISSECADAVAQVIGTFCHAGLEDAVCQALYQLR